MLDTSIRLFINIVLFMLRILCHAVSLRFLHGEIKLLHTYVPMLDTLSPIYGYTDLSVSFIYVRMAIRNFLYPFWCILFCLTKRTLLHTYVTKPRRV